MVNAIAVLQGAAAAVFGYVSFQQCGPNDSTAIFANLTGVPPGKHGLHVHQYGDLTNGNYSFIISSSLVYVEYVILKQYVTIICRLWFIGRPL